MRKTTPWTARLAACLLATAAAGPNPLGDPARAALQPPREVVEAGNDAPLIRYSRRIRDGAHSGGYWRDGPKADQILQRLDIGITDLLYKLEHGYRNYAHGGGSTHVFDINNRSRAPSFRTTIPLWTDVLQPFHQQRQAP